MQIYKNSCSTISFSGRVFMIKKGKIKIFKKLKLHLIAIRFLCYFKDYLKET